LKNYFTTTTPFIFYLPNFFQQKLTKHELEVRFKLFQVFTSGSIEKEIFVQEFFKSYPSVLNNQQKTKIKKHFIDKNLKSMI
jgi:hypothetical protein